MNFVSIDLETANSDHSSICAIGMVKVVDGEIVKRFYSLVNPECDFHWANKRVHGITEDNVKNAPTFFELDIESFIGEDILVAHNSSFEITALRKKYELGGKEMPYDFICTLALSRIDLHNRKDEGLTYKLVDLCKDLLNHTYESHNALEDAEACALLFVELLKIHHSSKKDMSVFRKALYNIGYEGRASVRQKPMPLRHLKTERESNFLEGQVFCITGKLPISKKEAALEIVKRGGKCEDSVTLSVTTLVVGERDLLLQESHGEKSLKIEKAEYLIGKGYYINIISDNQFLSLIGYN
jgi:DNA polymerase-3 subunit epsilon